MITTLLIVALSLLILIYLGRLAKGQAGVIRTPRDLRANLRPLDLQAFRNLTSLTEDEYLRSVLPRSEYRKVQRARLRTALAYISCAAENAAVLVRLGEAVRQSGDLALAEAGEKLVNSAIRLRIYAFRTTIKLRLGTVLPAVRPTSSRLAESYELMTRQGLLLGRMQYPTKGISSALL
jgi:hypothetical protein